MKKKIFIALLSMLLIITAIPVAVNASNAAPEVKASGTDTTFITNAPISTLRIDRTKINTSNVSLYHPDYSVGFRLDDEGCVYATRCGVKAGYTGLGYFTLTFADAAILADGTRKSLVVKFNDVTTIGRSDVSLYYDYLKFVQITNNENTPLVFTPLSVNEKKHLCIRSAVTFSVERAGDNDTMLFAANHINTNRQGSINFENIVDASGHYAYSESMEPLGGIAEGADLYITENSCLSVVEGKSPETYGIRFVGNGRSEGTYSDGFATVAAAKTGLTTRVWSSAGTNTIPLDIAFFTSVNAFSLETAAGENGSISLWTDGTANSTQAAKLNGGTISTPLTYSVPGGKAVTLVINPDYGYELDTLTLSGQTVQPTRTQYQPNGSVSYELDVPAITGDTAVSATFKKGHIHELSYVNRTDCFGIDVNCTEDNCSWSESKLTVSANIPDVIRYLDGKASSIVLSGKDELASDTHNAVQAKLTYKSIGENPVEYAAFPYIFGEYTATITITDARDPNNVKTYSASKNYTYEKAEIEPGLIVENWTYGDEPVKPRLAVSTNPEYARTAYYYKPVGANDSAYTTEVPVNAGEYTLKAVRPETEHYKEGVAIGGITIYKAASSPTVPTGITAVYGTKLADVALPKNWTWDNGEQKVGNPGDNVFSATFTPDDAVNYTTVQTNVSVNVSKRPITVTADDKSSYQGNALKQLTYTVSGGIVDGDDLGLTLNTNANSDVTGTYTITVNATNPNYDITLVDGTYTVSAAPEYSFYGNSKIAWTQGSKENAEFTVICNVENDRIFDKFTGIKIDGTVVNPNNYQASSGSVKISLKSDYLKSLSVGEHVLSVSFTDGNAEGTLNVLAASPVTDDDTTTTDSENRTTVDSKNTTGAKLGSKSKTSPATGNNSYMYFASLIACGLGLMAVTFFIKRFSRTTNNEI
ncbi:MAG: hypothetical protein IJR70_04945 [Eubacterium sp.]|nr:hypothetical protein [Eubacterium sp.]